MSTKKIKDSDVIEEFTFTKEKIIKFKRSSNRIDLLNALLDDNKAYTLDEVDALIDNFMKGKVK